MAGLRHTVSIAAPPERVWAVVIDVEGWPERLPTVDAVERLDAGP
ncbi:MAG: SRPBCC family protein, partial [Actinomycetes bacterium]